MVGDRMGLRRRVRRLRRAAYGAWFDWRGGVETTADVRSADHTGDRHVYQPTDVWDLPKVLPAHETGPDDVFVDVGSGKGRVVLFAARRYPFRRIVGVEVSGELYAVAHRNVAVLGPADRARIELVNADVNHWTVPDDATVFHLFNPFRGDTFLGFLAGVAASQRRRPRVVRMVYTPPVFHDDVVAAGFTPVRVRQRFTLYRRLP